MKMRYCEVEHVNQEIARRPEEFVRDAEDHYSGQLEKAARHLAEECQERPVVLLSGPSGSGKTTSAMRLAGLLNSYGHRAHTLSMDNYFLPHDAGPMPLDEQGRIDLESPLRLDMALLQSDIEKISNCQSIEVPIFDFAAQERRGSFPLRRRPGELVIMEGIHALNPQVTGSAQEYAACVYVSVRTRMRMEGRSLHPSKIRLMRRLLRDRRYRGREYMDTMALFDSVTRGEERFIMPYKYRAQVELDTFLAYEMPVYRTMLLEELDGHGKGTEFEPLVNEMVDFLRALSPLRGETSPPDSVVREFIGGSILTEQEVFV